MITGMMSWKDSARRDGPVRFLYEEKRDRQKYYSTTRMGTVIERKAPL
jgi:hypothetical protein